MPASKTIQLNPFKYSYKGEFYEADTITVFETTYETRHIDRRVSILIKKALLGCQAIFADLMKKQAEQGADVEAHSGDDSGIDPEIFLTEIVVGFEDGTVGEQLIGAIEKTLTNAPNVPRSLTDDQTALLQDLAAIVIDEMELRLLRLEPSTESGSKES